jgi:glycosyltransferase involved in cell wall biosynthesis
VVITSHGGDLFALKGGPLKRVKTWIINRADRLTVVSSAMGDRALQQGLVPPTKLDVIPMGVDSQGMFRPPDDDSQRQGLMFVGRLVDKKGIEYLIEAMPAVLRRHPNETLTIIGDGPLNAALQANCKARGIAGNVKFLGAFVNQEIAGYLQAAAVTVFPSVVTDSGDQEGTPVAIMEALACANAVVVSDYPGVRDIIDHDRNGLLVAQKSADELAAAILSLLDAPERRQQLGEAGRRTVAQHYDWRVISGKFLSTFQELIPPGTGGSNA